MYTDPIADMLNRIRTGQAVGKTTVDIPFSMIKRDIALCLEKEGFIEKVLQKKREKERFFRVVLSYDEKGTPVITEVKRISSPGQRIYKKSKDLRNVKGGRGISVVSTPQGIMTNKEARSKSLGGEVLCEMW